MFLLSPAGPAFAFPTLRFPLVPILIPVPTPALSNAQPEGTFHFAANTLLARPRHRRLTYRAPHSPAHFLPS
jgi:hypothetical protein